MGKMILTDVFVAVLFFLPLLVSVRSSCRCRRVPAVMLTGCRAAAPDACNHGL